MDKLLIRIFFSLYVIVQTVIANESIYIDANMAIKMIEKNNIQFIISEKSLNKIKGSKSVELPLLFSGDILGKLICSPLYSCPKTLEKYFSSLGINNNQPLILYDNNYGVYAATLYTIFESLGHKNITILDGGIEAISKIDPNQKSYSKYKLELDNLLLAQSNDINSSSIKPNESKLNELKKKLEVLKSHLLIEKNSINNKRNVETSYIVSDINFDYLLSKNDLKEAVKKRQLYGEESNITIIDTCPMVDIVGSNNGNYLMGVKPISWKSVLDKENHRLKPKEELELLFKNHKLDKNHNNYLYCMSASPKALFMMTVMRELGYSKVKAFTGDWNHWEGDVNE